LTLVIGVMKTEGVRVSLLFQWTTLLDSLMSFQSVFPGESLPTGLAQERFVAGVGIPMPL
jgi:hypothetical protein